jgi:tetratricopeptide (TPR) repeat protein
MASAPKYKAGDRILAVRNAMIQVDGQDVGSVSPGTTLNVGTTNGELIWVVASIEGWLPADALVPFDDAVYWLTQRLKFDPMNVELLAAKAFVRCLHEEWDKAIEEYTRLIQGHQDAAGFLAARGFAHLRNNNPDQAFDDFCSAIDLDPKVASGWHYRGHWYQLQGEHGKAITDFDRAIRLDPFAGPYSLRGQSWQQLGNHEKALVDFSEAVLRDPRDDDSFLRRGISWHALSNHARAVADFTKAITLGSKEVSAFYNRGLVLAQLGSYGKAVDDYNAALVIDPGHYLSHNNLAWIRATCPHDGLRGAVAAIFHAQEACQLSNWTDSYCLGTLAAAYAEAGNFSEAVKWQEKTDALYSHERLQQWGFLLNLYKQHQPFRDRPKQRGLYGWPGWEKLLRLLPVNFRAGLKAGRPRADR